MTKTYLMQTLIEEKEEANSGEKDWCIWVSFAYKGQRRLGYFDIMEWKGLV